MEISGKFESSQDFLSFKVNNALYLKTHKTVEQEEQI